MKKLGIISHMSNKGKIILRSDNSPRLGLHVFNKDKKKIGSIHDVFGPTKKPYISVRIYAKNIESFEKRVGEQLFISSKPIKSWGRKKRKKK
ncbi:MAG: hypothetical protein HZC47_04480 [Methanobacterium sp.]|uniref:H/ACA ribonucleoprotein complex subunit GAR1 n=1 Tax=Methanobacterium sp. TaxID=2164 RepID=UPI003D65FC64|nr:hypothetical protein [Methanobacterium sp.]